MISDVDIWHSGSTWADHGQCRIKGGGVLGMLLHPGQQFWGPAIGGSGKLVVGL